MNSSTKFMYNLLLKLKFPIFGYLIIIALSVISFLVSLNLVNQSHPFTSILLLSATLLPFFIMPFAVVQLFAFRSEKAYNIFLATIPFTHKKQLKLVFIILGSLVVGFSVITFFCTLFFNQFVTLYFYSSVISFSFVQFFNMSFIYFLTLLLFTSFLVFLKLLLTHNRPFYIALFFFALSVFFLSITPPQFLLRTLKIESLLPLPFNILSRSPYSFPIISAPRILFFLGGSVLFIVGALSFYQQERKTHQATRIQTIATVITYSLFLTPTLYIIYNYAQPVLSLIALLIFITIASIILKISFKKISLVALLVPFLFANSISIPLVLATPHIFAHQQIEEWNRSQFTSTDSITLSFSEMPLFGQNHTVNIHATPTVSQKNLLHALSQSSAVSYNFTNPTSPSQNTLSTPGSGNLVITWKSESEKRNFAKFLENFLIELDKSETITILGTVVTQTQNASTNCNISGEKPTCDSNQPFKHKIPSTQRALENIQKLQTESNNSSFYTVQVESTIWPALAVTISR